MIRSEHGRDQHTTICVARSASTEPFIAARSQFTSLLRSIKWNSPLLNKQFTSDTVYTLDSVTYNILIYDVCILLFVILVLESHKKE